MLDAATCMMRDYQRLKVPVLVHCAVGCERSPLVVAYFLRRYQYARTLTEAYQMIRAKRPQILDRRQWLEAKHE
jgi:protein-tyrosine phosphatase